MPLEKKMLVNQAITRSNVLGNSKIPTDREEKADRQTTAHLRVVHDFPKKKRSKKKIKGTLLKNKKKQTNRVHRCRL